MKKTKLSEHLPSKLAILGIVYKVKYVSLDGELGNCNPDTRIINIDKDQSVDDARSTLLHEALHAAFAVSGQSELFRKDHEEAVVRMLEAFLFPVSDVTKLEIL